MVDLNISLQHPQGRLFIDRVSQPISNSAIGYEMA